MTGPPPESWAVDPAQAGAREVVPGLWRLRLPVGWEHMDHVNAYAIERDDGVLLVDCGSAGDPSCLAALERGLAAADLALSDVRALALTHAHSDHVGLAAHFQQSGIPVFAHPDDRHFHDAAREPEKMRARREDRARREGVPEWRLAPYADVREETEGALAPLVADRPLRDGAVLETSLGAWEVIETPGHSPSHVCLLQRERRLAIVGDLICAAFVPWFDYGWTLDPVAEMLASLDRLDEAGPLQLALPGHGRPLEDAAAVTAEHRAGLAARLEATLAALDEEPASGYEVATRAFGEAPDLLAVGHLSETLSYLRHLRRRGAVTRLVGEDGAHRYAAAVSSASRSRRPASAPGSPRPR